MLSPLPACLKLEELKEFIKDLQPAPYSFREPYCWHGKKKIYLKEIKKRKREIYSANRPSSEQKSEFRLIWKNFLQGTPEKKLTDLPNEMIYAVLSFLDPISLCKAQATCKKLNELGQRHWGRLYKENFPASCQPGKQFNKQDFGHAYLKRKKCYSQKIYRIKKEFSQNAEAQKNSIYWPRVYSLKNRIK